MLGCFHNMECTQRTVFQSFLLAQSMYFAIWNNLQSLCGSEWQPPVSFFASSVARIFAAAAELFPAGFHDYALAKSTLLFKALCVRLHLAFCALKPERLTIVLRTFLYKFDSFDVGSAEAPYACARKKTFLSFESAAFRRCSN